MFVRSSPQISKVIDLFQQSQGGWTAPLHYTNLPRSATSWQQSYCPRPPSCVVQAVRNYTSKLFTLTFFCLFVLDVIYSNLGDDNSLLSFITCY